MKYIVGIHLSLCVAELLTMLFFSRDYGTFITLDQLFIHKKNINKFQDIESLFIMIIK